MHCCYTIWHIECGKQPLVRCGIMTWHTRPIFRDMGGDGRLEVRFADTSYAYWNECLANSPFPSVVRRIRQGHYSMAGDIMQKLGPLAREVTKRTKELRQWIAHYDELVEKVNRGEKPPENDEFWDDRPLQM